MNQTESPIQMGQNNMHMGKINHNGFTKKKNHPLIVVFRGLFDAFLKMRYNFYAQLTNGDFSKPADSSNVGLSQSIDGGEDDMNVMV